jgi:hypothetical protein
MTRVASSSPERGGEPLAAGEWWWGPTVEPLQLLWAPSTMFHMVPLPVPGRIS